MSLPSVTQVLVIEPDIKVARTIATVALDALPSDASMLLGIARGSDAANVLIENAVKAPGARLLVVCATTLADGGHGLDVLDRANRTHPDVRVVLVTNGERDEILRALTRGVDGIVARPLALASLRSILHFLGTAPERAQYHAPPAEDVVVQEAREALERAMDAVESAHARVRDTRGVLVSEAARRAFEQAERLAVEAHRHLLEAERDVRRRPTTSARS